MKKILTFVSILSFGSLFGQQIDMNKWSLGLEYGSHFPNVIQESHGGQIFHHMGGNVRYMFNSKVGLMANLAFETYENTNLMHSSIQGVFNLTDILNLETFTNHLGLTYHFGGGWGASWERGNFGFDDKFPNFTMGLSPRVKLGERVSMYLDLSAVMFMSKQTNFDFEPGYDRNGFDGYFWTQSVGLNVYLGKKDSHADWTPTGNRNAEYEARLDAIEQGMKDDDNDGVANYLDQDNNTPEGATVNTKGEEIEVMVDTDGDGVADEFDACPETAGLFSANGCPDADGDGVADDKDNCPNEAGVASEGGCPSKGGDFGGIMPNMMVNFDLNKAILKEGDKLILKNVAKVMKDNPSYKLVVDGHTDNSGSEKYNQNLSKQRAAAVMNFLTTQGVESSRITMNEYGETQPIASNATAEGRAINRRAEFSFAK